MSAPPQPRHVRLRLLPRWAEHSLHSCSIILVSLEFRPLWEINRIVPSGEPILYIFDAFCLLQVGAIDARSLSHIGFRKCACHNSWRVFPGAFPVRICELVSPVAGRGLGGRNENVFYFGVQFQTWLVKTGSVCKEAPLRLSWSSGSYLQTLLLIHTLQRDNRFVQIIIEIRQDDAAAEYKVLHCAGKIGFINVGDFWW